MAPDSFFGPGVRWHPEVGGARPYLQANFLVVSEEAQAKQGGVKVSSSEGGTGFGLFGGVDVPISKLLSLPLEENYIYAMPADDVSGFGFTVGLAFNFGEMPSPFGWPWRSGVDGDSLPVRTGRFSPAMRLPTIRDLGPRLRVSRRRAGIPSGMAA